MSQVSRQDLQRAAEAFWESFLPFWHKVRAYIRETAEERFDITVEQFHILRHIRKGRASVSELAEAKNISRPAISQAVNVLVNKGLIARTPDPKDRRHIRLDLTAHGNTLLDDIFADTRRWMTQLLTALEADELQSLIRSMESLKKAL